MSTTKTPDYTFEQELALRTDINLSLMANAGSGKTFVLVERFRKIINDRLINQPGLKVDTSSILAITFTKKAAAEMKKKVIDAFDRELKDLQENNTNRIERLEQLKRIREGLTYSNISTIHSFCASLLRKFPVEAGIPVNFSEMSEAEKHQVIDSSIDSTIDFLINQTDSVKKIKMEELIFKFGRKELKQLVALLLYKIELFDEIEVFLNQSNEEIRSKIFKFIEDIKSVENKINEIKEFVDVISNDEFILQTKRNGKTAQNLFSELSNSKNSILDFEWDKNINISLIEYLEEFNQLRSLVYTKDNQLRKNLEQIIIDDNDIDYLKEFQEILPEIDELMSISQSLDYLDESLELSRDLWGFVREVRETADDMKIYLNELDFDDLQMKVKELLKNKDVVNKIRSQIDYIMIDEFQDTNQLQYDIMKALVPEINDNTISNDDINLFIVGDPKQSIYGFRNADVRVFLKAVDDIYENNLYKINNKKIPIIAPKNFERNIDNDELFGKNRLTSTFRLRPEIAAFVNKVCANIMGNNNSAYEVDYSPLVCSRDTDKIDVDKNSEIVKNKYSGEVVFLLSKIENSDEDEEEKSAEEEKIADYIINLINDPEKDYQYKDIAILSRAKTHFSRLSRKLTERDIPHVIHSGNTFFTTEEISDFISFLNFIYNPEDDIALSSILRAPFFNINDTKLLMLKGREQYKSLWENLMDYCSENENKELDEIYQQLKEILELSPAMSISQVILMIIEKTGWMGVTETSRNKNQKIANIDKLIEMARQYEQIGFKNIYDFIEQLKYVSENEIIESEAVAVTGENAVNIMTIHASKGLQFPVVILYKTNAKHGGGEVFPITGDFGFGFSMRVDAPDVVLKNVDTPIQIINKIIKKEAESAEDKRILYVAMTRAEDVLALSVQSKLKTKGTHSKDDGLLSYILEGLGITIDDLFDENDINDKVKLDIRKNKKIIETQFELQVKKIFEINREEATQEESSSGKNPLILLKPIVSKQEYIGFSPSKFNSYDYAPAVYFDRYVLGLPDELTEREIFLNAEKSNTPGNVTGTVIHFCLQYIDKWLDDDFSINEQVLKDLIDKSLKGQIYQNIETVKSDILMQCINVAETELIKREFNNIKNSDAEYYLSMPLGSDILHGYIDLPLKKSDGTVEVWDWKSNIITSDEDKLQKAKSYELQMQIYTYFISKLYPGQQTYSARLLFTRLAGKDMEDEKWTHKFTWQIDEFKALEKGLTNKISEIKENIYL